jgi:hypothetical protein
MVIGHTGYVMAKTSTAQFGQLAEIGSANVLAEYRLASRYRRPFLKRLVGFGALTILSSWVYLKGQGHFSDFLVASYVLGPIAIYNGVVYIWRGRFRTRLTAEGIEIRGYFNHFVPWRQVDGFEESGYGASQPLGTDYNVPVGTQARSFRRVGGGSGGTIGRRARLGTVRVVRSGGRRLLLRAPLVTSWAPDPYFEQKVRELRQLNGQYGTRPIGP